jgi:RNase H-like domain found in reverse transcriptase
LRCNPCKSFLAKKKIVFLGFEFSSNGSRIDPKRLEKIRNLKPATNAKEVEALLGFFCYFKRFIRGFSAITSSLRELLRRDVPFLWEHKHDAALQTLKQALLENVLLIYPNMNEKFYVVNDASKSACSHVLLQEQQGVLKPLICGGRAYRTFERHLCATDLELLSVLDARHLVAR